jgi:hypothetical protein
VIVPVPAKKESGSESQQQSGPWHPENHAGGVYDDPDGKLDGLARPYVLTGGYVELAR